MKKSRIAKLALLGASTAALAATLTTSTYAWYVTNKEANIKGGTASTGTAGADGSVLLSWTNNENSVWSKELNFTTSDGHPTISNVSFQPCHPSATNANSQSAPGYYGVANNGYDQGAAVAATSYLQFTVYAKTESSSGVSVNVDFNITNTTTYASSLLQLAYVATGAPTGLDVGEKFLKDATSAMYVRAEYNDGTAKDIYVAAETLTTASTLTDYVNAGGNAHTYYKEVQGWYDATLNNDAGGYTHNLWAEAPVSASNSFSSIALTTTPIAITYTIFLDGGDTDCFNSCAGQTINFAIKYSVA